MLRKKMFKDMMSNKLAYTACIVVITIGLMMYCGMSNLIVNLFDAQNSFYTNQNFADIFAEVMSYPNAKIDDLLSLEGIREVDARLKEDVSVITEDDLTNVTLRLISYDTEDNYILNDVFIDEGYALEKNSNAIWLGSKFFEVNGYEVGDTIGLVINSNAVSFTVAGAVQSPEYVYATKNSQDIYPDPKTFDIAYVEKDTLEKLLGMNGLSNAIAFELEDGYLYEDVELLIEDQLKSYGLLSLVDQENQISNFMISQELLGLQSMSKSMPILFLGIASFILYIMIKRLIEKQRVQIGTLKAVGYSQREVRNHYLSYALWIGLVGGILGGIAGTILSDNIGAIYNEFFSFPNYQNKTSWLYVFTGLGISIFFSYVAGYYGARYALQLSPAEAMRPEAPKEASQSVLEKVKFFWNMLNIQGKMAIRNISRSKGRSIFTFIGVTFTFALLVASWSFNDIIDAMLFDQFEYVQLYDLKANLKSPQINKDVVDDFYNIKGVNLVEPLLEIPIQLNKDTQSKNTVLVVPEENSKLYHITDKNNREVKIEQEGLYLSENIANDLGLEIGDIISVSSSVFDENQVPMTIVGTIPQYLGANGYAKQSYINEFLVSKNLATSVISDINQSERESITRLLNESKYVVSADFIDDTENKYRQLIASYGSMLYSMAIMSMIIGFAIVYNSSIIAYSEREREIASLKVLGMSNNEVLEIISFEQWILGFFGMIIGVPLGYGMMLGLSVAYQTDVFSMPAIISPTAFLLSIISTIIFIVLAQLTVKKRIEKMDIVEVLKERE